MEVSDYFNVGEFIAPDGLLTISAQELLKQILDEGDMSAAYKLARDMIRHARTKGLSNTQLNKTMRGAMETFLISQKTPGDFVTLAASLLDLANQTHGSVGGIEISAIVEFMALRCVSGNAVNDVRSSHFAVFCDLVIKMTAKVNK